MLDTIMRDNPGPTFSSISMIYFCGNPIIQGQLFRQSDVRNNVFNKFFGMPLAGLCPSVAAHRDSSRGVWLEAWHYYTRGLLLVGDTSNGPLSFLSRMDA